MGIIDLRTMESSCSWSDVTCTGVVPFFMPEIHHSKENRPHSGDIYDVLLREDPALRHTRTLMAYLLPNDVSFGRYLLHIDFARRIWRIRDDLADATHYSHIDGTVSSDPPAPTIQCGLYVKPDGNAVLAVGNISDINRRVTVEIDPGIFSLARRIAEDVLDADTVQIKGQQIVMEVVAKDFRLIQIR